ncbi:MULTISPECIES: hypothetical protein [unclassified Variovorax]|uniref:hypothetical protein n=1 Tax=unclassified Variovorax TaxID=663243 RepID=UPI003F4677A2
METALATAGRRLAPDSPLTPVSDSFTQAEGQLRGVHLLQHHCCSYGDKITATDVIEVDFDQRVIHEGLYIIAHPNTAMDCGWFGARMFQRLPQSGLHIFEGDQWIKIHEGHRDMQVIGRILNVYRRTR